MTDPMQSIENEIDSFNRKGIAFIKRALGELLRSLVRPLATITEVYFRMDFGVRYFTAWNVLGGLFLIYLSNIPLSRIVDLLQGVPTPQWHINDIFVVLISWLWLLSFAALSVLHMWYMRQRVKDGVLWHSYSCGYAFVPEWLQPLIPIALGIVLFCAGVWMPGLLLIASGLTSANLRRNEKWAFYTRVLDTLDAQIEAENLSQAIMERGQGQKTCGFAAPLPAIVPDNTRRKFLQSAVRNAAAPIEGSADGVSKRWAGRYAQSWVDAARKQVSDFQHIGGMSDQALRGAAADRRVSTK